MIYPFNGLEISWKRKEIVQDQFARLVNSRFEELLNDFEIVFILMRIKEGDIIVENTYKKRTHQTRDAFLEALLPHDYPQEQIHYINYTKCEDVFVVRVMLIRRPLTSIPRFVSSPYVL